MANLQQLRDEILKQEELLRIKEKLLVDREHLAEMIETNESSDEELKKLKKSLRRLDTEIDMLDAFNEGTLYKLKQDYILLVLKSHPEKRSSYEQALEAESRIHHECKGVEETREYLMPIQFHLTVIEQARNRIKKLWILSYLIGNSPNYEITHSWLELRKELDKEMPARLTPHLQEQIHTFRKTIKDRWGLGIIDREVRLFHIHVKKEMAHIEKALSQLKESLKKLDEDLLRL